VLVEEPAFRPALRRKYRGALAPAILRRFRDRIGQLHVSEVNTENRHDRLSLEILAFQKVCQLVPPDVPMILESRVDESEINEEIRSALAALNPAGQLAVAGDGV
jgi:hypothetical protein